MRYVACCTLQQGLLIFFVMFFIVYLGFAIAFFLTYSAVLPQCAATAQRAHERNTRRTTDRPREAVSHPPAPLHAGCDAADDVQGSK
jgi:hypothetical protein